MLGFFRKHQRIFFIFVTTIIVISFTFFGGASALINTEEVKDEVIGKAVDGSNITRREVEELARFISSSAHDAAVFGQGKAPNLLNDDVVRQDFLANGMGEFLAERFFDLLQPEVQERFLKVKNSVPYTHPHAPSINVSALWQQFQPSAFQHIVFLKNKCEAPDAAFFALLAKLSVEQLNFPSEMVRRILSYQQNQHPGIRPDENLQFTNLHPFGFETMEDWLGKGYLQLISQYIINAAKMAEQRGYSITNEEVRADLCKNIQQGLAALHVKENPSVADAQAFFGHELRQLGLAEGQAIKVWKKVMLFRRLFNDAGSFGLVDALPFETFNAYADESADVVQYAPSDALRLRDFRTLLKFQIYLEGVAGISRSSLQMPKNPPSAQEVERRAPEFIQRKCRLEWREVKKDEVAQRITLKETWQWEGEDNNWQLLQLQFPFLARGMAKTPADRLNLLDNLKTEERYKIDRFARFEILKTHPEWIEEAFGRTAAKREESGLRLKGSQLPFASILSMPTLIERLSETPTIALTSRDEEIFYRVKVLEIAPQNEILTFAQLSSDGTLDKLLDARLEEAYPEVRKKNPTVFQQAKGEWKPLLEVRDEVGALLYAPLLKAIEDDWKQARHTLSQKEGAQPLDFYTGRRLYPWMCEMRAKMLVTPDDITLINSGIDSGNGFEAQWKLKKSARSVKRSQKVPFAKDELFTLHEGGWSSVGVGERGEVSFCQIVKHNHEKRASNVEQAQVKEALAQEARQILMRKLLDQMVEKQAIGFKIGMGLDER